MFLEKSLTNYLIKRKKIINFLTAGLFNTIFGYILFVTLIFFKFDYKLSLFLSYFFGILFNYFSYKNIAFGYKFNKSSFIRFILSYIIVYNINLYILRELNILLNNLYLSQLISLPIMILLTWVLLNRWVFK